jgi:hypothetical protein
MTDPTPSDSVEEPRDPRKGPLSFFSGAVTAGFLAWLALGLSRRMVMYFATHPPHYNSPIAQNIASHIQDAAGGVVVYRHLQHKLCRPWFDVGVPSQSFYEQGSEPCLASAHLAMVG